MDDKKKFSEDEVLEEEVFTEETYDELTNGRGEDEKWDTPTAR